MHLGQKGTSLSAGVKWYESRDEVFGDGGHRVRMLMMSSLSFNVAHLQSLKHQDGQMPVQQCLLTHFTFSFLSSSSSCSACLLLVIKKIYILKTSITVLSPLSVEVNYFLKSLKKPKPRGRYWWEQSDLCSSIILSFSSIFLSLSSASLRSFKILSFSRRRLCSVVLFRSSSLRSSSSRWTRAVGTQGNV